MEVISWIRRVRCPDPNDSRIGLSRITRGVDPLVDVERGKGNHFVFGAGPAIMLSYEMAKSIYDNIARPVQKRSAIRGTLVGVRLQSGQINALDAWAAKQNPPVTRPEAIRGMIDAMLHILSKDPGDKPAKKARPR
jgi:hypothetical protein